MPHLLTTYALKSRNEGATLSLDMQYGAILNLNISDRSGRLTPRTAGPAAAPGAVTPPLVEPVFAAVWDGGRLSRKARGTLPNQRMKLSARGPRSCRNAQWRRSILIAPAAGCSLCAFR